jgi:hypothetical protein
LTRPIIDKILPQVHMGATIKELMARIGVLSINPSENHRLHCCLSSRVLRQMSALFTSLSIGGRKVENILERWTSDSQH